MKTNLIKKFFFVTFMLIGAMTIHAEVNDTIDFPILDGGGDIITPPRAPICGIVNETSGSVCFITSAQMTIERVWIRRSGVLVVADDAPDLLNNILSYDLSAFGNGAYTVELYAEDQTVYIGQFSL